MKNVLQKCLLVGRVVVGVIKAIESAIDDIIAKEADLPLGENIRITNNLFES